MSLTVTSTLLYSLPNPKFPISSSSSSSSLLRSRDFPASSQSLTGVRFPGLTRGGLALDSKTMAGLIGAGFTLALLGPESASAATPLLQLNEPQNALSLPTWAIHVSSVVEWITAMALVWQYGDKSGNESWKGLSWGMVPLLGGAFCACTWHFFYNSQSLEAQFGKNKSNLTVKSLSGGSCENNQAVHKLVLVALQAILTAVGNATMCIAAFRIYKSSQENSSNL